MRRVLLAAVLACCLPAATFAADWPQFRGPLGNGISPERGLAKSWRSAPRMLWRVALSDNGYSGPAVAGGRVYIIDHQGRNDVVRALDARTGRDVWRYAYPEAIGPNYGYACATPAVSGGKVYTMSRMGQVNCLDAARGKKIWSVDIVRAFQGRRGIWNLAASPVVDGNKVILVPGGENATVVALNKDNGRLIWKCAAHDVAGYATPTVATLGGRRQYVVFTGTKVFGADAASGRLLWAIPWKTDSNVNAAKPVVLGNSVFITSAYNHGCALIDVSGGKARVRWQNREIMSHFNAPVAMGGALFSTSDPVPGNLVCLDPRTGRALWKQRGFEKGGLAGADGMLIAVNGQSGDVVLLKASTRGYQEAGRFRPLGGQSWSPPVIANGTLLLRNTKMMAAFSLR